MKWLKLVLLFLSALVVAHVAAQPVSYPLVELRNLNGQRVDMERVLQDSVSVVVFVWRQHERPSCTLLSEVCEITDSIQVSGSLRFISVLLDDHVQQPALRPFVEGQGINHEVLVDHNGSFGRFFGVDHVPYIIVFGSDDKPILRSFCRHTSDAGQLCRQIQEAIIRSK